ncbi:hypothetical protein P7D85_11165 [Enterococcus hulanensis]|uniref:Transposase n=1 Tax=Enterococcus hulanensis TaxID=2559929 RepID=A0ABU3F096_9ENTE|nr:hypothetical protein [Enterococcus hulanensis]MDT2600336.1 hypothetical protein [Enterococcus hulanensis]MDT2609149.1 hypothetical protein [Enterococcus hulanensis]MDT2616809.1 hypothetical protein [Enterococcus hulanensis]MDT2628671.1 hypothetical protein [Enterococcus hulanensis]MDT2656011.1 hypothetical protein [Enterococcus hulanensis]
MIMNIEKSKAISDAVIVTAMENGRKEGLEEGRKEEKRTLAIEFLKIGVSPEKVAKVTGLDIETVHKLKNQQA